MLASGGVPALPVGVAEDGDGIQVRVGEPFLLEAHEDRLAAEEVMRRIAVLLPERMRGRHSPWVAG
jgi:hypothetical protein